MSDLQWKIEDGHLWILDGGYWLAQEPKMTRVFEAAILATQEKCAHVAKMIATVTSNRIEGDFGHRIASAIRSLKMETGQ